MIFKALFSADFHTFSDLLPRRAARSNPQLGIFGGFQEQNWNGPMTTVSQRIPATWTYVD